MTGLRERKKAATRALIAKTAERLFGKHGFDAVTLERVADECVVSAKTVLRYFPTKEALALARLYDLVESFKEGLDNRDTDAVGYWRAHVADSVREELDQQETVRSYIEMIHAHPNLEAHFVAIKREYEGILAEAIAKETTGDDGVGARVLAALLVAGNAAVSRYAFQTRAEFDPEMWAEVADYIIENFPATFPYKQRRRRR